MYSDKMRFTGMSGIDTQSMITQLMKAESMKLNRYQKSTQLIQWKQDAYRGVATDLNTFKKTHLDFLDSKVNMLSSNTYRNSTSTAKVNGSDTTAVNVKATNGAISGNYKLEILSIAEAEKFVGTKEVDASITSSSTIDPTLLKDGDNFNISLDGESVKKISFTSAELALIGNDVTKLAANIQTKVDAMFLKENGQSKIKVENDNGKLSFKPLKGHAMKISEGSGRTSKEIATSEFDTLTPQAKTSVDFKVTSSKDNMPVTIKVDLKKGETMSATEFATSINKSLAKAEISGLSAIVEDDKIVFKSTNASNDLKVEDADNDFFALAGFGSDFTLNHVSVMSDLKIPTNTTSKLNMSNTVSNTLGIATTDVIDFEINGVKIDGLTGASTMTELFGKMNNLSTGVKVSFDELTKKFKMESTKSGEQNAINISAQDLTELNTMFGFDSATGHTTAKDAVIKLNGITTTRSNNNFTISDISLELKEITTAPIDITINKDTSSTIDNIKNFVIEYNKMIESLNKQLRQKVPSKGGVKTYNPLTDEERKGMSAEQIKSWDEKAKEGLLYNDSIIKNTLSSLRANVYESVELSNGKKVSLFQLGITTTKDYKDGGKLEIKEEQLKKYIEDNPDDVAEFFTKDASSGATGSTKMKEQGVMLRIKDVIDKTAGWNGAIAEKAGIKGGVTENTSTLSKQLVKDQQRIKELTVYLKEKENYYYNMFSKMEVAITQSNSQMDYMMSQFG